MVILVGTISYGQQYDTLRVASYNLLNYPGTNSAQRNPEFRKIVRGLAPDILIVQEMTSAAGMAEFFTSVVDAVAPGVFTYVPFHDGPDTDNGLYYRTDKWEFISASYITGGTRDIAEYIVRPIQSTEQLRIYSLHLKASTGTSNEQQRLTEATLLRDYLNALPAGTNFIIAGDFNIYTSSEPAWTKLTGSETNNVGQSMDPLNLVGTWNNNAAFALYHTQSPRVRAFGGGSTGGMDDRFDIILTSTSMSGRVLTSTYQAYGNDGNHFNDSINRLPNAAVPDSIANALHNASDHLPVTARFIFPHNIVTPVQLVYFGGTINATRDSVVLQWRTISETNNFGFEVQKRTTTTAAFETIPNSFIPGHGTTIQPHSYRFADPLTVQHTLFYRLKQIDLDGTIHYSEPTTVNVTTSVTFSEPAYFTLSQNYPNPFNPSTRIRFAVPTTGYASIHIYDVLGQTVATLYNSVAEGGKEYSIQFDGMNASGNSLPSGVYFYRLVTTGAGVTPQLIKRMILLR